MGGGRSGSDGESREMPMQTPGGQDTDLEDGGTPKTPIPEEEETNGGGKVIGGDGGFELEDGDLVTISTDHNGDETAPSGTAKEAGNGKWVDDDHDPLLKTQRRFGLEGKEENAAVVAGPAPALTLPPAPNSGDELEARAPMTESKHVTSPEGAAEVLSEKQDPDSDPPNAISPEPHAAMLSPSPSKERALVPAAAPVPNTVPSLPPVDAPGVAGMKFGSMDVAVLGG
ncbi:hypothetical protein K458DRAFT_406810 [Lentithecium fluviatile CBS 122367]|uniref:Uncharacterized protein n=1 Tax=Lentithecium fluviatile CBS 122367 TaxID=1168545 RepID=A0A6G1ISI2_9PLEO|nr:hypothetical protein K458DRAFT_406810 [Lentithecium fluviatile CBS 122367]